MCKGLLGSATPDFGGQGREHGAFLSHSGWQLDSKFNPELPSMGTCSSDCMGCLCTDEDNGWSELASLGRRAYQQNDKFRIFEDIWSAVPQPVTDRDYNGKALSPVFSGALPQPQPGCNLPLPQPLPGEQWGHLGPSFFTSTHESKASSFLDSFPLCVSK